MAIATLTIYTEWPEDLWSGLPRPERVAPRPPAPPERPFLPDAVAAGQPIRSLAELDRVNDGDLSPRLRDLRDDPRGYSKRTGRPYPPALRQFRMLGAWGCYERRLPPPAHDPWLPGIRAFLVDKAFVTSTEIWRNGCPPARRRHAFRRIAPLMRHLGWWRWRTDFIAVWVRPDLATPKRSELMRLTGYMGGRPENTAARQPRPPQRHGPHLQDLDRREAALAAWAEEGGTAMTTQAPSAGQQQDCGEATGALGRQAAATPRRMSQVKQRELIRAALAKDPTLPDLRIARAVGFAATTVARVREAAGIAPYCRHRDRRPPPVVQVTKGQLCERLAALSHYLEREQSLRIEAERALAAFRANPPDMRDAQVSRPPLSPPPPPATDPATGIPGQVPTHGRGLPVAVWCQECGDTRFWTDSDARIWRCAGCHPPGPGQLLHKTGRWH
jgi:hypothetical protein